MLSINGYKESTSKFERGRYVPELLVMVDGEPADVCFTNIGEYVQITCHWRSSGYTGHCPINHRFAGGATREVVVFYGNQPIEIKPLDFDVFNDQGKPEEYFEYLNDFDWWANRVQDFTVV